MKVEGLFIYPIKSLKGISLDQAQIGPRGFKHDRRWMLIEANGQFITQRAYPVLSLLAISLSSSHMTVRSLKDDVSPIQIPLNPTDYSIPFDVTVWGSTCSAVEGFKKADQWFSQLLKIDCKLVYMPDDSERSVDPRYGNDGDIVSFADGYPYLIIGQAALDQINQHLEEPVKMDRFRPNIVFSNDDPFVEDSWDEFLIGQHKFRAVKPCARCTMLNVNQQNAQTGKEPLKTLSTFRKKNNKIYVGQNLLWKGGITASKQSTTLRLGDELKVLSWKAGVLDA